MKRNLHDLGHYLLENHLISQNIAKCVQLRLEQNGSESLGSLKSRLLLPSRGNWSDSLNESGIPFTTWNTSYEVVVTCRKGRFL